MAICEFLIKKESENGAIKLSLRSKLRKGTCQEKRLLDEKWWEKGRKERKTGQD